MTMKSLLIFKLTKRIVDALFVRYTTSSLRTSLPKLELNSYQTQTIEQFELKAFQYCSKFLECSLQFTKIKQISKSETQRIQKDAVPYFDTKESYIFI